MDSAVATQLTGGSLGSAAPIDGSPGELGADQPGAAAVVVTAQALFNFASTIGTGNSQVKNPFYVT